MQTLKAGDVVVFHDVREEVLARVDGLIWTRSILPNGGVGALQGPYLIEDYITYGWRKESK